MRPDEAERDQANERIRTFDRLLAAYRDGWRDSDIDAVIAAHEGGPLGDFTDAEWDRIMAAMTRHDTTNSTTRPRP